MQAVYLKVLPQPGVDVVLPGIKRFKVDKHGNGTPGDVPAPYLEFQAFDGGLLLPIGKKRAFGDEILARLLLPTVGTDKDHTVFHHVLKGFGPGRQHRIDSAYFVANFPTRLKNIVGK